MSPDNAVIATAVDTADAFDATTFMPNEVEIYREHASFGFPKPAGQVGSVGRRVGSQEDAAVTDAERQQCVLVHLGERLVLEVK